MINIYLSDLHFYEWPALYRLTKHPQFFYRAPEPRIIMSATRPEIETTLQLALEEGRYTYEFQIH